MNDGPVIRSNNQGVAKVLGTATKVVSAFSKPIKKAMKDTQKIEAKQSGADAAKKESRKTTKKTTTTSKSTVAKPLIRPKTSGGKVPKNSSRPNRPRTLANRAKTPRGR